MSSLSPKADMLPVSHHVRFGPNADMSAFRCDVCLTHSRQGRGHLLLGAEWLCLQQLSLKSLARSRGSQGR